MNHKVTVRVGRMLHKVGRLKKASDLTDSETNRIIFHLQKTMKTEESAVTEQQFWSNIQLLTKQLLFVFVQKILLRKYIHKFS